MEISLVRLYLCCAAGLPEHVAEYHHDAPDHGPCRRLMGVRSRPPAKEIGVTAKRRWWVCTAPAQQATLRYRSVTAV